MQIALIRFWLQFAWKIRIYLHAIRIQFAAKVGKHLRVRRTDESIDEKSFYERFRCKGILFPSIAVACVHIMHHINTKQIIGSCYSPVELFMPWQITRISVWYGKFKWTVLSQFSIDKKCVQFIDLQEAALYISFCFYFSAIVNVSHFLNGGGGGEMVIAWNQSKSTSSNKENRMNLM